MLNGINMHQTFKHQWHCMIINGQWLRNDVKEKMTNIASKQIVILPSRYLIPIKKMQPSHYPFVQNILKASDLVRLFTWWTDSESFVTNQFTTAAFQDSSSSFEYREITSFVNLLGSASKLMGIFILAFQFWRPIKIDKQLDWDKEV